MTSEETMPSGLYIDVENLQDYAQDFVVSLLDSWPCAIPYPTRTTFYVPADMVELWQTWVLHNLKISNVDVKGIQHFSAQASKNSADIMIAVDAISDFLKGRVGHIAVFSDDSDFISLFAKIRTETIAAQSEIGRIPFLWILTDRDRTKSPKVAQFFPTEYLHYVHSMLPSQSHPTPVQPTSPNPGEKSKAGSEKLMALALIRELPVGKFKSADVHRIIKELFPRSSNVHLSGAAFGVYVANSIWPHLEDRGVKLTGQKPRTYEMTQTAKDAVT